MAAIVPLLPVPPLCVCLRTLSRRRAQRAPLSRDVNHRGPFAWEFPGRLLLRRRKTDLSRDNFDVH